MNERKKNNSLISVSNSKEESHRDVAVSTESGIRLNDGQVSPRSTYDTFLCILCYIQMFMKRFLRDLFITLLGYVYCHQNLPAHVMELMNIQRSLHSDRESQTVTYRRKRTTDQPKLRFIVKSSATLSSGLNLSSEDCFGSLSASDDTFQLKDREPVFVLVDSSCVSSPSSKELLIDEKNIREPIPRKHYNKNVQPIDMPSTSRDFRHNIALTFKRSDSSDEMQVIDINLQSENEIPVDERQDEEESIVVSYLRNKDAHLDVDGTILSSKKKSSLLDDVPKMETIVEGEQFRLFPLNSTSESPSKNDSKEDESENI